MFSAFRKLLGGLEDLVAAIRNLNSILSEDLELRRETGTLVERIESMERGVDAWEATCEATLLKADSKLRSANNAEARARTMENHAAKFFDEFDPESEEPKPTNGTPVPAGDDPRGEEEGVFDVPLALAGSNKANAMRLKFL